MLIGFIIDGFLGGKISVRELFFYTYEKKEKIREIPKMRKEFIKKVRKLEPKRKLK